MCRFCFEGPGEAGELISPCRCAGGQKYVHLSCLRSWQRAVLVSQPTHPDLYDMDTRQRICNVCKAEFNCPPPTRAELLASFTGPELAALIDEGCVIASAEGFSRELEQQVMIFPEAVQERIVCRNWVRGAFLITRVVAERERGLVPLRVSDAEDLAGLVERLGEGMRNLHLRGRRFTLLLEGPLGGVPEGSAPASVRAAILALATPVTLLLQPAGAGDCGDDGIVAVNLTRPVSVEGARLRTFRAAAAAAQGAGAPELPPQAQVTHLLGGPCEEERASACIVARGSRYRVLRDSDCLVEGLCQAELLLGSRARAPSAAGARPSRSRKGRRGAASGRTSRSASSAQPGGAPSRRPRPSGRRAGAAARHRPLAQRLWPGGKRALGRARPGGGARRPGPSAGPLRPRNGFAKGEGGPGRGARAARGEPVRVLVFWGYAGWSRCQLMGEIARGSWGLCRAPPDVLRLEPARAWRLLYPRLIFAPRNDLSETFDGEAPEEEARRRELRRMAIFHDLFLRQTGRARRVALRVPAGGEVAAGGGAEGAAGGEGASEESEEGEEEEGEGEGEGEEGGERAQGGGALPMLSSSSSSSSSSSEHGER